MKIIKDKNRVLEARHLLGVDHLFQTKDIEFLLIQYEKGEMIFQPSETAQYLLFLVEGKVKVYDVSEEGDYLPRVLADSGNVLGDIEFFDGFEPRLFCEAYTDVQCLAISKIKYQRALYQDVTFLHFLLKCFGEKINLLSTRSLPQISIEDRLLLYMKNKSDHTINSVNEMTAKFGCSRRQLQRVLQHLCETGTLEKTGRGSYLLVK